MERREIVSTAEALAEEVGLANMTKRGLCERCGISLGSFSNMTGMTFTQLVESLVERGVGLETDEITRARVHPTLRRLQLLNAALEVAETQGVGAISARSVAEAAGVSRTLVSTIFPSMSRFREDVMREAVERKNLEVLAQGLAVGDPIATGAPEALKRKVMSFIKNR